MNVCTSCDGQGSTADEEHDELGRRVVAVRCENCGGVGELDECSECREPMPPGDHRMCGGCLLDAEREDQADEMARARRVA